MSESKISVTVNVPEGLPSLGVIVTCRPKTRAEFDAVVEAVGGACAFGYHGHNYASASLGDGYTLHLNAPESEYPSYSPPRAPSVESLKAACER